MATMHRAMNMGAPKSKLAAAAQAIRYGSNRTTKLSHDVLEETTMASWLG